MAHESDEDPDRAAILRRRTRFVARSLAELGAPTASKTTVLALAMSGLATACPCLKNPVVSRNLESADDPHSSGAEQLEQTLDPRDFTNANQLVWNDAFQTRATAFFGAAVGSYLGRPGPVSEQWMTALGGPPDQLEPLADGWQFAACRLHSCPEKAWVLLDGSGTIQIAALRHIFTPEGEESEGAILTIFFRNPEAVQNYREHAERWSDQHGPVVGVELVDLR